VGFACCWRGVSFSSVGLLGRPWGAAWGRLVSSASRRARFKAKYHFGWTIGIVYQHQTGIELEPLGLLHHGELVLTYKALTKELGHRGHEGDCIENVPGSVRRPMREFPVVVGVTVVRLANHFFPQRRVS